MAVYKSKNTTKDGRTWFFKTYKKDINGINKAYKSKKYITKKEAQEAEALFLLKRDNPTHTKFVLVARDYFEEMKKIRKESTIYTYFKDYNKHISPYFDDLDINDINIPFLKEWANNIEKQGFKLAYKNKIYNILKNILDHAIKNYGLKDNPLAILGRFQEKRDKIITDEEKIKYITLKDFNKFIEVIDNDLWKTFFLFAFYTGCRKGEIVALTWKDINFSKNEITINKTLYEDIKGTKSITSTKNNLNRKIKLNKILREQLVEYKNKIAKYIDFDEDWFVFGNKINLSKTTIDRKKHYYFQLADVKEITMHEFRHSHVSLLINEYVKSGQTDTAKFFLMMSNRMGHTIGVMQKTYMHLFPTIQDEIIDILDNL